MKRNLLSPIFTSPLVFLFLLLSCTGNSPKWIEVSADFIPYVSAYTGGIISSTSSIRVRLAQDIRGIVSFGEPIEEEYFDFEPSIVGKTKWIDASTIEFVPEKRLPQNQQYTAHFNLGKLLKVPEKLEDMAFSFKTIQQSAEVKLGFPQTYSPDDFSKQYVEGTLTTADKADLETVKKTIQAKQSLGDLTINWSQSADQHSHFFKIEQIKRPVTKEDILRVNYEGDAFENDETEEWTRSIVPQNEYRVVNASVVNDDEPRVEIVFSDPLLEMQDLTGLIQIQGIDLPDAVINGHVLSIYKSDAAESTTTLSLSPGILNVKGKSLEKGGSFTVSYDDPKPDVRFPGGGVILPSDNGMIVPFEAVSLKKVDVQITKIFENNIPQFLQNNELDGSGNLKQVGKIIAIKTIPLETAHIASRKKYSGYALNLNELIKTEPGAIYRVELSFQQSYATCACLDENSSDELQSVQAKPNFRELNKPGYYGGDYTYYEEYEGDEYNESYDWRERNNPCSATYYMEHRAAARNILSSNIGLLAKSGADGSWQFISTDILTAEPLAGVDLKILDYQQQQIATLKTDRDGFAFLKNSPDDEPFLLLASQGKHKGYLKLNSSAALGTSQFEVSGEDIKEGLKGFLYAERGVWRPGDTLFINLMLEVPDATKSAAQPIIFEILNSRGQRIKKEIQVFDPEKVIYSFPVPTNPEATTGNYSAQVSIGSTVFQKSFKVETIQPNRLKIDFNFPETTLRASQATTSVPLRATWLHGSPAANLRANVAVTLSASTTSFPAFKDYIFDDPSRTTSTEEVTVFDGLLNDQGETTINPMIRSSQQAPGQLKADFTVRVFEQGGGFSIDRFSIPYLPYSSFAGIKEPEGEGWANILSSDKQHTLDLACVDDRGKGIAGRTLTVNFYKTSYEWWWQRNGNINDYYNAEYAVAVRTGKVTTNASGKANFNFSFNEDELATYLVRVCDETSGHCTGTSIYIDDDSWMSRTTTKTQNARDITLKMDKEKYTTGESIKLSFPSPADSKALLSIEDGSHVLESRWINTTQGQTEITFKAKPEYAPNVYAHITVLQPHQHANELPVRMYGVLPVYVEDPSTRLEPIISLPDIVRPETVLNVGVKEKSGQEMEYTIALVDDGLLDLTRFKTPDPWSSFYAKEALGVVSWDLFDDVIGAYAGAFESIVTIGGDAELDGKKKSAKANRFRPMVRFIGPFKLKKGASASHKIAIPSYFGSARIMVIAGNPNYAYGSAEKKITIRKPLMVLTTLPRVVSPGETIQLPINIFALDKSIKNVNITCSPNAFFKINGAAKKISSMRSPGESLEEFELKVVNTTGIGKVKVTVSSGNESATAETEIEIRSPNVPITDVTELLLKPGEIWKGEIQAVGIAGTREASIELSGMPAINLSKRLKELTAYPHGCLEQTTSAAFPQIYLSNLVELSEKDQKRTADHVRAAIKKIGYFQLGNGGMAYWPGAAQADEWSTSYVGHFLVEAQHAGYPVSSSVLKGWKNFQKVTAKLWKPSKNAYNQDQIQSYRLYTLSLAGSPELGAMNRMREMKNLNPQSRWHLAGAYELAGQHETALAMLKLLPKVFSESDDFSFGSIQRDEALVLLTLSEVGMEQEALKMARKVAMNLGANSWMSTQTTAWSLVAIAKQSKNPKSGKRLDAEVTCSNKLQKIAGNKPLVEVPVFLDASGKSNVIIKNTNKTALYVRLIRRGIPGSDKIITQQNNGLTMNIQYNDMTGRALDPASIPQGTDFTLTVSVQNSTSSTTYTDLAFSLLFASGWEFNNTRVNDVVNAQESSNFDYQDIRDDRVQTYFHLSARDSKVFKFKFNASYTGTFYLPSFLVESMYDNTIYARTASSWVRVVRPQARAI